MTLPKTDKDYHNPPQDNTEYNPVCASKYNASIDILSVLSDPLKQVMEVMHEACKNPNALISETVANYIAMSGGKHLRPALTIACYYISYPAPTIPSFIDINECIRTAATIEMLHNATLLHDDVIDASDVRRNRSTARKIWGNSISVLAGDFILSRALSLVTSTGNISVINSVIKACENVASGEIQQLSQLRNLNMTMEEYLSIITMKTGALFATACHTGGILADSDNPEHHNMLYTFGNNLGITFQITDDILDYSGLSLILGKNIGDDFKEGKVTLPVIIAVSEASSAEKTFWERCFTAGKVNDDDFEQALTILNSRGCLQRAEEYAFTYANKAREALESFAHCASQEVFKSLSQLTEYCIRRKF